jgi:alpha-tubulin suppressor-like RCC1 family protein
MALTISGVRINGALTAVHIPPPPPPPYYIWSWGQNYAGALGQGDTANRSSPVQIGALTNWLKVSGGKYFSLAVKTDGTMWSWGQNSYGKLGLGNTTSVSSPVQVGALTNWLTVSASDSYNMAVKTDGTMWAWGRNDSYGQLGLGNQTNRSSPTQIGALTNWLTVSAGYNHNMAVKTDGTMWSWGQNSANKAGQLGLGDLTDRSSPVQIGALTTWSSVSAGKRNHSIAVKTDGTMWTWGMNSYGALGLGNTTGISSPVQIGALTTWLSIAAGYYTSAAIKTDGTLWAWGKNGSGRLGLGDTTNRSSPVQIGALTTWLRVSASKTHSAAIKTDGTMWSWGQNTYGQLGLGNTAYYSSPKQVGALTAWLDVSAGTGTHILAISN